MQVPWAFSMILTKAIMNPAQSSLSASQPCCASSWDCCCSEFVAFELQGLEALMRALQSSYKAWAQRQMWCRADQKPWARCSKKGAWQALFACTLSGGLGLVVTTAGWWHVWKACDDINAIHSAGRAHESKLQANTCMSACGHSGTKQQQYKIEAYSKCWTGCVQPAAKGCNSQQPWAPCQLNTIQWSALVHTTHKGCTALMYVAQALIVSCSPVKAVDAVSSCICIIAERTAWHSMSKHKVCMHISGLQECERYSWGLRTFP